MRAPTIVRTRSRRTVGATTYERSDWAPDNKYDYWYSDLPSR
jgi:hypothetical protein